MTEWTVLDLFTETEFDTPELVTARKEVNAEINAILNERQRIADAIAVVNNTPVEKLTVESLSAGRIAKEDGFRLLQRELLFRKTLMASFIAMELRVASAAVDLHQAETPRIEATIIKGLEKLGYLPFDSVSRHPGQWDGPMVRSHPKMIEASKREQRLRSFATNYALQRQNRELTESIQTALTHVRNSLVG